MLFESLTKHVKLSDEPMSISLPSSVRRTTRILRRVGTASCVILLLGTAALLLATRFALPGGWRVYSVLTGSMEPAVPAGSLIINKAPLQAEDIQKDTIITFAEPGLENQFITHRVHEVKAQEGSRTFITKGDANAEPDSWTLPYGRIQGVYKFHAPYAGRVLEFMKSPFGLVIFIIVPVVVIMVDEIRSIVNVLVDKKVRAILQRLRRDGLSSWRHIEEPAEAHTAHKTEDSVVDSIRKPTPPKQKSHKIVSVTFRPLIIAGVMISAYHIQPVLAAFISNSVTISSNSLSTAAVFTSPSPTASPTPEPTTSPSPTEEPSPTPDPSPSASPDVEGDCDVNINVSNENTGPGSTNENNIDIHCESTIEETNNASISNEIDITANTGGNTSEGNTEGGTTTTGSININLNSETHVNSN